MVKIKTDSWHYKLIGIVAGRSCIEEYPKSLCSYFWLLVASIALSFTFALIILMVLFVSYLFLCTWGTNILLFFSPDIEHSLWHGVIPALLLGAFAFLTSFLSQTKTGDSISHQLGGTAEIVSAYSHGFFNKYCPKINYEVIDNG